MVRLEHERTLCDEISVLCSICLTKRLEKTETPTEAVAPAAPAEATTAEVPAPAPAPAAEVPAPAPEAPAPAPAAPTPAIPTREMVAIPAAAPVSDVKVGLFSRR